MFRKLRADEVQARISQVGAKGCSLLLYKDARVDRAILDETFGEFGWQNDFKVIDGKMYGYISVYDKDKKEWITKSDCGVESNTESEKGQASDCFKRAGFKWGIGVELYTAPFIFVSMPTVYENGKYRLENKYMKFSVKEIGYADNGDINKLIITDDKGNSVYTFGYKKPVKKAKSTVTSDDAGYYIGLSKIENADEVQKYYEESKAFVNNPDEFHELAKQRWKVLKGIAA